jgi:hypothetical protein
MIAAFEVSLIIRFAMGASRRTVEIEDAKIPEFKKVQQGSTSCPHLIESEAVENRCTFARDRNPPWAQALWRSNRRDLLNELHRLC